MNKKYLAIVSVTQQASGLYVALLGVGKSESAARGAAFDFVNTHKGGRKYDEEYEGGTLVTLSKDLAALLSACERCGWDDTVDETGGLVESSATDVHHAYLRALGRLYVVGDELRSKA